MAVVEVKVPDIGDFESVEVIEVLVKPGDRIEAEQSLVTVESDKASMEIPSSTAGIVRELRVKVGDKVSEGTSLLMVDAEGSEAEPAATAAAPAPAQPAGAPSAPAPSAAPSQPSQPSQPVEVRVPDIGDFDAVAVIEVMVKPGDTVKQEQSLITVESDKASMEIPSSHAGVVQEVRVEVGDKVSEGSVIALVQPAASVAAPSAGGQNAKSPLSTASGAGASEQAADAAQAKAGATATPAPERTLPTAALPPHEPAAPRGALPHASPSIRRFARELGVPLEQVKGSGPNGRITQGDVQSFVKGVMSGTASPRASAAASASATAGEGFPGLIAWPKVDFAKFGAVERKDLSRIQKLSGANLHRNWVLIPHVTNHDDADITDLEAFRVTLNKEYEKSGVKVTMLAFLVKALVAALRKFPQFNASLDGEQLVLKKYFHIGFAADTPNGLVVPVVKDADRKGIVEIARETSELAAKAREGKLGPADMTGGCFSISSLGGIGGRYFTPIINAPEVAILGVCRSTTEPVWDGKTFQPRLRLPLSLSWDHRVIDGAAAARFNAYLCQVLADFRRVML